MADISVDFDPRFEEHLVRASLPSLRRIKDDIDSDMHEFHRPHIKTGKLDRSIFTTLDESTGEIVGGATTDYADDLERGHQAEDGSFVEPRPFVRPSFLRRRGAY